MEFSDEEIAERYEAIRSIWHKRRTSEEELTEMDLLTYYAAVADIHKVKFLAERSDHHKERRYLQKSVNAEAKVEELANRINESHDQRVATNYCRDLIATMGPEATVRFWG